MPPPPLLGYNNNVRHRGRVFHIQTEDSGVASPRIMTHLFADGGRIVKSTRTDYSQYVGRSDMTEIVKNLMKEQHKGMFVALRSGEFDSLLGFDTEEEGAAAQSQSSSRAVPPSSSQRLTPPARVTPAVRPRSEEERRTPAERLSSPGSSPWAESSAGRSSLAGAAQQHASAGEERAPASSERPYSAPRPAALFQTAPSSGNIFGDVGVDEKSLDDAILSYIAEEPKKEKG